MRQKSIVPIHLLSRRWPEQIISQISSKCSHAYSVCYCFALLINCFHQKKVLSYFAYSYTYIFVFVMLCFFCDGFTFMNIFMLFIWFRFIILFLCVFIYLFIVYSSFLSV